MQHRPIIWINTNPNAQPDERGYWESLEGRFEISPNYRHTIYPDSYTVRDNLNKAECTHDRVRDCKFWAQCRLEDHQGGKP